VVVPDRTDPSIVDTVINGRGVMSAQRLDDQQVADGLAWMRTAWPLPPKE
jgi:mono/diheme cytochrome c family protein